MSDALIFSAYEGLPFAEQALHGIHFMLCSFAVMTGCAPMAFDKGSIEHKIAGRIYLPLSFAALSLACAMAWNEHSLLLFCFSGFCAWLLLSGWRAVHETKIPQRVDWLIPSGLLALAGAAAVQAILHDQGIRSLYLLLFAGNACYLGARDLRHVWLRAYHSRHRVSFAGVSFGQSAPAPSLFWLNRHVAGMAGSWLANLSVIVLTLLPPELHVIWPASLTAMGAYIAWRERQKKQRVVKVLAPILTSRRKTRQTVAAKNLKRAA